MIRPRAQDTKLAARLLRRADILIDRQKYAQALEACRQGIAADPGLAALHRRAGAIALLLRQPQAACESLERAVSLDPYDADALCNLGVALRELGRPAEACARLAACLRLTSTLPSAWYNLGIAQADLAQWEAAVASLGRALQGAPRHAKAAGALASALLALGRADQAASCARRALAWAPDFAELHVSLGEALLSAGELAEGWREYEWRWHVAELAQAARHRDVPRWQGEALRGRTLLLHGEQGFGDMLQMARYVARISDAGLVVLDVPAALARLFRSLAPADGGKLLVVAQGQAVPECDLQCPLMSLPAICGTRVPADVPNAVPYLRAEPQDVARWRERLADLPGLRVGLCWSSGSRPDLISRIMQARKSVALAELAPLGAMEGCSLVSLQTGEAAAEAGALPALQDVSGLIGDFADTAALIACLDLVVTVDTAVAHLAGALGGEVWLLNRFDADWRWSAAQQVAPWYPTLRQFRQPRPGDWGAVVEDICRELRKKAVLF